MISTGAAHHIPTYTLWLYGENSAFLALDIMLYGPEREVDHGRLITSKMKYSA